MSTSATPTYRATVIEIVWEALEKLYKRDGDLFGGEYVKEECMNHRIAMYIQESILAATDTRYAGIKKQIESGEVKVDMEYDKAGDLRKNVSGASSRPDLLIHRRGCNSENYAFIEIKKQYLSKRDIEKCKGAKQGPYNYRHAFVVDCLAKGLREVRVHEIAALDKPPILHRHSSGKCCREKTFSPNKRATCG